MIPDKHFANKRLLFVVNTDWFFLSHRLALALAAKEAGFEVWVAAPDTGVGEQIRDHGLHYVPIGLSRSGTAWLKEIGALLGFVRLYRKVRPDIVHLLTIKPVLYGSLAARLYRKMPVVSAVTGTGYVFSENRKGSALQKLVKTAYRIAFGKQQMRVIFQNAADLDFFVGNKLADSGKSILIRGSGVDTDQYSPRNTPAAGPGANTDPVVLMACRMLWDKGVGEFAGAAARVKAKRPEVRFWLAGITDEDAPGSVPSKQLEAWQEQGLLEWLGHRNDMPALIAAASIVALPTHYPEGVPRILIEAAASGKPIVTSDRPGCNDIVRHGLNGLLIPQRDPDALAGAILTLIDDREKMARFGTAGRELACGAFSQETVIAQTLAVYAGLIPKGEGSLQPHNTISP